MKSGPSKTSRAALALVASLALATTACTTTLEDAKGKADASVKLTTQKQIDDALPEANFWAPGMKSTDSFKEAWLANCKDSDYPDPKDTAEVEPKAFTITGTGNGNGVDSISAVQLDVGVKITAFEKRSDAKAFQQEAVEAMEECPASEEVNYGSGGVATFTFVPADYKHESWTGKLLLSKVSRAPAEGDTTKDVQITALVTSSNISVMVNLYGLASTDQDETISELKKLFDSYLDELDTAA